MEFQGLHVTRQGRRSAACQGRRCRLPCAAKIGPAQHQFSAHGLHEVIRKGAPRATEALIALKTSGRPALGVKAICAVQALRCQEGVLRPFHIVWFQ